MTWWRRHYGAGPLHLLGLLLCFAVAAYAVTRVLDQGGLIGILVWFVGCVIIHDLIGWPAYALADRLLVRLAHRRAGRSSGRSFARRPSVPWINHVRVPVVISAVLFGISFPLIFRLSQAAYLGSTGFTENVYLANWLEVSGVVFAGSAFIYVVRLVIATAAAPSGAKDRGVG